MMKLNSFLEGRINYKYKAYVVVFLTKSFWLWSICKVIFLYTENFHVFMYKAKLGKRWKIIITNKNEVITAE